MMQKNLPKNVMHVQRFCLLIKRIASALSWLLKLASSITRQNNLFFRGIVSFSTSCMPRWLSFPHILKTACMTSTHWPHQHFHLLSFLAHPNNAQIITSGKVIKPKILLTRAYRSMGWLNRCSWYATLCYVEKLMIWWKTHNENNVVLCYNGELFLWVKSRQ